MLDKKEWTRLEEKANEIRNLILETTSWAGSGHIGGGLSATDILTVLYYKYLNIDVKNPDWEDRDRLIVSKGHIGIALAPIMADLGFIEKEALKTFNLTGSVLGIHLDSNKVKGIDASTGSLGHGLAMSIGMALAAKIKGKDYWTYCVLGDGECDEGSVWESAMSAAHFKVDNLITFVDRNHNMIDGNTEDIMRLEPFADKWRAFGFEVIEINGHDIPALCAAIEKAKTEKCGKPYLILCDTIKGCGIDYMEDNYKWHYGAVDQEKYDNGKKSLQVYFEKRMQRVK